ncbi:hypothetical protein BT63DRAFT_420030 [Microthyrium microscopicum]|uniref:ATP synthase F(0) complex subunit e, mitochondrial n=1 Tax=Microthyrium microscopicum TaxID=703497 RepID=A0A6A6UUW6_9PEZI|nr:hypothetical protein BT63DRAFT_420030 [Microthyrium microscopicum]
MASSGVNVLRWSALGLGVFYGFYHQLSISSGERLRAKRTEWEQKENLISQAKAEFQKSKAPAPSSDAPSSSKAPADPKEDLEAFPWLQESK